MKLTGSSVVRSIRELADVIECAEEVSDCNFESHAETRETREEPPGFFAIIQPTGWENTTITVRFKNDIHK